MTNIRNLLSTFAAIAILSAASARADSLSIQLSPSILGALPGQTVTFSGTITNNEAVIVDLNGCDVNLPGQFATDCGVFLGGPLFLNPHETSAAFDMFTVTVGQPFAGPLGLQPPGTFTVLGGLEPPGGGYDPDSQNLLGTSTFAVVVTPEPGSAVLLGLALVMTLALRRRSAAPVD